MDKIEILNTLESKLKFKLGEEQKNVLLSIFSFFSICDFDTAVIKGSAGTGKSTITKIIIDYLKLIKVDFILAAPTNKSRVILQNYTKSEAVTLHKLLNLRPTIDILDLDYKDLQFTMNTLYEYKFPFNGVLIIDECSMINESLYNFIITLAKNSRCKVIFQGDPKQLSPINEQSLSKTFLESSNLFELTKVYRQNDDNPILNVLLELRDSAIFNFTEITSKKGNLKMYTSWKKLLKDHACKFKDKDIKLIAYTNRRVSSFNEEIRKELYLNPAEYEIGDILVGYDNGSQIFNSEEYVVKKITDTKFKVDDIALNAFTLILNLKYDDNLVNNNIKCTVISKNNSETALAQLAEHIEKIRLSAINAKTKKSKIYLWRVYFNFMDLFIVPFDLKYKDRVIRKKSIDYGYCITVHKSQSSTYKDIIVDMGNIRMCSNQEELRQLQYVALSRTQRNIYMLT